MVKIILNSLLFAASVGLLITIDQGNSLSYLLGTISAISFFVFLIVDTVNFAIGKKKNIIRQETRRVKESLEENMNISEDLNYASKAKNEISLDEIRSIKPPKEKPTNFEDQLKMFFDKDV